MQLPPNINLDYPENYKLFIRITSSVFAYCVCEVGSEFRYHYEEVPFPLEANDVEIFQQLMYDAEFFTLPFERTEVIYVSQDYDLIPNYIIQKDKKELLYNFTHHQPAKQILYSPDPIYQVVTAFNVEEEIYKFLVRTLNAPEFYHHSNVLMKYLDYVNLQLDEKLKMYLNFHDGLVDVFCYTKNARILHALTLSAKNERNLIYYLLNMWNKAGFDQKEDLLYILTGSELPYLSIPSRLGEYIKNIEYLNLTDGLTVSNDDLGERPNLPLDLLIQLSK